MSRIFPTTPGSPLLALIVDHAHIDTGRGLSHGGEDLAVAVRSLGAMLMREKGRPDPLRLAELLLEDRTRKSSSRA